jgi:hypothetical protein
MGSSTVGVGNRKQYMLQLGISSSLEETEVGSPNFSMKVSGKWTRGSGSASGKADFPGKMGLGRGLGKEREYFKVS